jgi:hypothetical protein
MRRVVLGVLVVASLSTCERDSRLAKASASGHEAQIVRTSQVAKESRGGEFGPKCSRVVEYRHVQLRVDDFSRDITTEWSEGQQVELVAAPDGVRFAYRIAGGPWRPVWLGKRDLIFAADSGRLATGSVDFGLVPSLPVAAKHVFRDAKYERERILAELAPNEIAEVLRHSLDAEGEPDDAWSKAFRALSPEHEAQLRKTITERIAGGEKSANVLLRYANEIGIRSEKERSVVLATLASIHTHELKHGAKQRLVAQAARLDLAATAAWSCKELERYEPDGFFYPTELYWVMSKAKHACDTALPQLELMREKSCVVPTEPVEKTIDIALGKLAADPALKNARYIHNEEALSVFAKRTLSDEKRRELCRAQGAQAPLKE